MATIRKKKDTAQGTPAPVPASTAPRPEKLKPTANAARSATKAATDDKGKEREKDKKPKLVRDSFTIPKVEYAVLGALKLRAAKAGAPAKKSEILRAGIKTLASLSDEAFLAVLGAVPSLKTGRPAKE